jgi:uncharacterized protein YndB with AHSA1/START domain
MSDANDRPDDDSADDRADDRVEHTFVVAVAVERAWQAFTDGAERSRWEAPEYAIDPRPGGKLRWRIPPWQPVDGEVLEVEPQRRLVATEGEGVVDGATLVTVTFESVVGGTRITVVQSGFGTGARWRDQLEGHREGWLRSLRDLALYLETGVVAERFFSRWHCDLGMYVTETFPGLRVSEVVPGGWADEAGVRAGDLVLYLDRLPIFERTDIWPFQIDRRPGDRLAVDVARAGARIRGEAPLRPVAAIDA